jgi:hypothetical protein
LKLPWARRSSAGGYRALTTVTSGQKANSTPMAPAKKGDLTAKRTTSITVRAATGHKKRTKPLVSRYNKTAASLWKRPFQFTDSMNVGRSYQRFLLLLLRLPLPPLLVLGLASFTFSSRPSTNWLSSDFIAAFADDSSISTKANPRNLPVSRSVIQAIESTVPYSSNISRTCVSVAL